MSSKLFLWPTSLTIRVSLERRNLKRFFFFYRVRNKWLLCSLMSVDILTFIFKALEKNHVWFKKKKVDWKKKILWISARAAEIWIHALLYTTDDLLLPRWQLKHASCWQSATTPPRTSTPWTTMSTTRSSCARAATSPSIMGASSKRVRIAGLLTRPSIRTTCVLYALWVLWTSRGLCTDCRYVRSNTAQWQ